MILFQCLFNVVVLFRYEFLERFLIVFFHAIQCKPNEILARLISKIYQYLWRCWEPGKHCSPSPCLAYASGLIHCQQIRPQPEIGNGNINNWTINFDVSQADLAKSQTATFTIQLAGAETASGES